MLFETHICPNADKEQGWNKELILLTGPSYMLLQLDLVLYVIQCHTGGCLQYSKEEKKKCMLLIEVCQEFTFIENIIITLFSHFFRT